MYRTLLLVYRIPGEECIDYRTLLLVIENQEKNVKNPTPDLQNTIEKNVKNPTPGIKNTRRRMYRTLLLIYRIL